MTGSSTAEWIGTPDGRRLYAERAGRGLPIVVFEAGMGSARPHASDVGDATHSSPPTSRGPPPCRRGGTCSLPAPPTSCSSPNRSS